MKILEKSQGQRLFSTIPPAFEISNDKFVIRRILECSPDEIDGATLAGAPGAMESNRCTDRLLNAENALGHRRCERCDAIAIIFSGLDGAVIEIVVHGINLAWEKDATKLVSPGGNFFCRQRREG